MVKCVYCGEDFPPEQMADDHICINCAISLTDSEDIPPYI